MLNRIPAPGRTLDVALAIGLVVLVVGGAVVLTPNVRDAAGSGTSSPVATGSAKTTFELSVTTTTSTALATEVVTASGGALSYVSAVSPDGLQLEITLNATDIPSRGGVGAGVRLLNTLSRNVSVQMPAPNQNISQWNAYDNVCGYNPSYSLVGFAVFKGHYSQGNVSSAGSPLRLAPPFYPPCALVIGPTSLVFLPMGDRLVATDGPGQASYTVTAAMAATTRLCTTSGGSIECAASPGLVGYWDYGPASQSVADFSSKGFVYLQQGDYTIIAADSWRQYVFAYFSVL